MKVAIAGGTGFVGKAITKQLLDQNHEVFILTRNRPITKSTQQIHYVQWLKNDDKPENQLENIDVFINLAGTSLNSGRWTASRKKQIVESRLAATNEIKRIISKLKQKPHTLLNASAIGYYGTSLTQTFTEQDILSPTDFLSTTVHEWELSAREIETLGVRVILMRFGVILGKEDGALPRIKLPYTIFAGGTVGSGKQWVSWIHIDDIVKAALFCIDTPSIEGSINFTAPLPVQMKAFGKTIGRILHKPHWMPAPAPLLKIALGEMSILVLEGQKVLPSQLEQHGFIFDFPTLEIALNDLLI